MANPLRYIKDLEAVGVPREQAEVHFQAMVDMIQGDFVTKSDFQNFKEHMDHRFSEIRSEMKTLELNLQIRLGIMMATMFSINIAILSWLIKAH